MATAKANDAGASLRFARHILWMGVIVSFLLIGLAATGHAQVDADVPPNWWTRPANQIDGWPANARTEEGIVHSVSDLADRLVLAGPTFVIDASTQLLNVDENDHGDRFDGRQLTPDAFAAQIEAGEANEWISVWSLPSIDGSSTAHRVQYGWPQTWVPSVTQAQFTGFETDAQGRLVLRTIAQSLELVGEVGDEHGEPLVDLFGEVLQPEAFPRAGDRVRVLIIDNMVVRVATNPLPLEGSQAHTWQHTGVVSIIDLETRSVRFRGSRVQLLASTQLYDAGGTPFDLSEAASRIEAGAPLMIEGEQRGETIYASSVDVLSELWQSHEPRDPEAGNWRLEAESVDTEAGLLQTVETWHKIVAVDADIVDSETGAQLALEQLAAGTAVTFTVRGCVDRSFLTTDELRQRVFCDLVVALETTTAADPDELVIHNDWWNNGIFARTETWAAGVDLVMRGQVVEIDGDTQVHDGLGVAMGMEGLRPGDRVWIEVEPSNDPITARASVVQLHDPQRGYDGGPNTHLVTIDEIDGDRLYLQGQRYGLTDDVTLTDDSGRDLGFEALASGQLVNLHILYTNEGTLVSEVSARDFDPWFRPTRTEEVTLARVNEMGQLVFAGPSALIVPRPEGSTRGTELLDRAGSDMSLEALRRRIDDGGGELKLILLSRTSRTTGEEVALQVRVYNYDLDWQTQVPDGAWVGYAAGLDGEVLRTENRDRWMYLAADAEILHRGHLVERHELPGSVEARLTIVSAPVGFERFFGDIVTRVEAEPADEHEESGRLAVVEGRVEAIDARAGRLVISGPEVRFDPFLSTAVDEATGDRIDVEELVAGDLVAIHYVPGAQLLSTQVRRLAAGTDLDRFGEDVLSGQLARAFDSQTRLLRLQGTALEAEGAEVLSAAGDPLLLDDLDDGDEVRVFVDEAVRRAVRVVVFGSAVVVGDLEVVSSFPADGDLRVSADTPLEVTFGDQVRDLLGSSDFDFGLLPRPSSLSGLRVSRDGRTIVADAQLQADTAYQLYVRGSEVGLYTARFTTASSLPAAALRGQIETRSLGAERLDWGRSVVFLMPFDPARLAVPGEAIRHAVLAAPVTASGTFAFDQAPAGQYHLLARLALPLGAHEELVLTALLDSDGDSDPVSIDAGDIVDGLVLEPAALAPFRVAAATPGRAAVAVGTAEGVAVSFTRPVAADTDGHPLVELALFPTPLSGYLGDNLELSADGLTLTASVDLETDEAYTLVVHQAVSTDGLTLDAPWVSSFSTGSQLPSGQISGRLGLPTALPVQQIAVRKPVILALVPFTDFDPLDPDPEHVAVGAALSEDGAYRFEHVPAGRYVVTAYASVAVPIRARLPLSDDTVDGDFEALAQAPALNGGVPTGLESIPFFGYSRIEGSRLTRDDVTAGATDIDIVLRPEDVRRNALRVVQVQPDRDRLLAAPERLDLRVEFSHAVDAGPAFVALRATMHPEPASGRLMDRFDPASDLEDGGRTAVFRGLQLAPGTRYRFTVHHAADGDGRSLVEPFHLPVATAGALPVTTGRLSGSVSLAGDGRIAAATVFVFDADAHEVEAVAGAVVEADGTFRLDDLLPGTYSAWAEVTLTTGEEIFAFLDRDGDERPDRLLVDDSTAASVHFVIAAVDAPARGAGPNAAATVTTDWNDAPGDQGAIRIEARAGDTVELAVYAQDTADLTGLSLSLVYDAEQLAFAGAAETTTLEPHILRSREDAVALFLPARSGDGRVAFGGAILSPSTQTSAHGNGLLGVLQFEVRDGFTGASVSVDEVVLNALGSVQDTVSTAVRALVVPPLTAPTGDAPFSFDFGSANGDDGLTVADGLTPGQEVEVAIYVHDVESLTNYSVSVDFDTDQVRYLNFRDSNEGEANFLTTGGGTAFALPPLLSTGSLEFGAAILGPTAAVSPSGSGLAGVLTFETTAALSETELVISTYSLRRFGGEQEEVATTVLGRLTTGSAQIELSADFDGDGRVGLEDFFAFADVFGSDDADPRFDLDGNGLLDFGDFFVFADQFGRGASRVAAHAELPAIDGRIGLDVKPWADRLTLTVTTDVDGARGLGAVIEFDPTTHSFIEAAGNHELVLVAESAPGRLEVLTAGAGQPEADLVFAAHGGAEHFAVRSGVVQLADGSLARPRELGVSAAPLVFELAPSYPNPFNPSTTVPFRVPAHGEVSLVVYDILGQTVRTLVHEDRAAGSYRATWDARDDAGRSVAAGAYLVRLQVRTATARHSQVQKVTLVK